MFLEILKESNSLQHLSLKGLLEIVWLRIVLSHRNPLLNLVSKMLNFVDLELKEKGMFVFAI